MTALTFRQRLRAYLKARGDIPPTPEWYDGVSRFWAVVGTLIMIIAGLLLTLPFVAVYLSIGGVVKLPLWIDVFLGIGFFLLARGTTQFLGAPVADTLLGIPREVPEQ